MKLRPSAVVLCLVAGGCLFGSETKTSYQGKFVDEETFNQIQPGASKARVRAVFGDPSTQTVEGGIEVWRYNYTKKVSEKGALLFIFASKSETEFEGYVLVKFQDDVVQQISRQ